VKIVLITLFATVENVTQLAKDLLTMDLAHPLINAILVFTATAQSMELAKTRPPWELHVMELSLVLMVTFVSKRPSEMDQLANKLELKQVEVLAQQWLVEMV